MTYKGFVLIVLALIKYSRTQCPTHQTQTFVRWSGLSPENVAPVFVYSASGEEESLTGACLEQCRKLPDCYAVIVAYTKGNCQGVADMRDTRFHTDSSVVYFKKICTKLPKNCDKRWWALESTPGYYFNSEGPTRKVIVNTTVQQCYEAMLSSSDIVFRTGGQTSSYAGALHTFSPSSNSHYHAVCEFPVVAGAIRLQSSMALALAKSSLNGRKYLHEMNLNETKEVCKNRVSGNPRFQSFWRNAWTWRSAQWIDLNKPSESFTISDTTIGNCILNGENKVTEPESYRVSNYYTLYIENQCGIDYSNKIDRCSYEEYNNQTLKHVDVTYENITRIDCKTACELESRFVCRGFSWTLRDSRGICDLHSEDLISTGSWLLRRIPSATYYRRVLCLNISVECEGSELVVTYNPRGVFRGRVYVPGRGDRCSSRAVGAGPVRLALPLYGECDVNFAYAISKGPQGIVNRTMAYVMLMIQNNPIIQSAGDRWVRAGCSPGAGANSYTRVDASVAVHDAGRPSLSSESSTSEQHPGASAVYEAGPAPLAMYVVRAHGDTSTAAVSLGELLELRIETVSTEDDAEIEAFHLVASSRLGDSSVLLLDSRGCPTGQVDFPPFTRSYVDGMQRLSARFKAFRFPSSHIVRFVLMVRFCDKKCTPLKCEYREQLRNARNANGTYEWHKDELAATVTQVLKTAGESSKLECGRVGRTPLEVDLVVGLRDVIPAETLVRADHRASLEDEIARDSAVVCVHELLLVALVLAWLTVQILLLLGCCVLVKRYRNLAEMNMQKDYQSFDNVGFDTVSTHRRVHWPDQNIDIIHGN